jgi:hypothetical protein
MTRRALVARASVTVSVVALALGGCTSEPPRSAPVSSPHCTTSPPATVLPTWARVGFSDPEPSMPHVVGDRGDITAILWADKDPLTAPPTAHRNNKILWVARVGGGDGPLEITAALEGTDRSVTRVVEPAPGPSVVDLPAPGCWSLDLTWGSHHDHLRLGYAEG